MVGYPDLLLFCNLLDKHSSLLYQEDKVSPLSAREEMCSGGQSGLTGVAWREGYLRKFVCVHVCVSACLPAHRHCAVDDVVYFFSLNTTAESSFCRGGCHYQLSSQ